MTFTEAAIEVLRREGRALHFRKITELAIRESLLDHVGKIPDEVMGGQLASHCRLPLTDRKVVVVQPGTFALVDWGLDEDLAGLENLIEPPPDTLIPYRPNERHPTPSREMVRSASRGEARARRREEAEERRGRRYPPPAEVAYEILAGSERPLSLGEIAAQGLERFLMPEAFVRDGASLAAALTEDNRRREAGGRRPLFALEGDSVALAAQPEPGERAAAPLSAARPAAAALELRKSALLALRRRLRECDAATIEYVSERLLEAMGLRELKVAKRGREHVVYTGRRKLGLSEVRHCIRILKGAGEPGRRDVSELRRDVGNYGAQIGVLVSVGDVAREARGEASAPGQIPVLLFCGAALAEALTESHVACRPVIVPEIDEGFFRAAAEAAQQEEAVRRTRREERGRREARRDSPDEGEGSEAKEPPAEARPKPSHLAPGDRAAVHPSQSEVSALGLIAADEDEGAEEDDEEVTAEGEPAGTPAEEERAVDGRRRRRRRRRRGGRGRTRENTPSPQGAAAQGSTAAPPEGNRLNEAGPSQPVVPSPSSEPSRGGEN